MQHYCGLEQQPLLSHASAAVQVPPPAPQPLFAHFEHYPHVPRLRLPCSARRRSNTDHNSASFELSSPACSRVTVMEAAPLAGRKRKKPEGVSLKDLPLYEPPAGDFLLSSLHAAGALVRLRVKGQKVPWLGARFPTARTAAFMAGEKVTAATNTPPKARVARSSTEGSLYCCQRGAQRRRKPRKRLLASSQPPEQPPRPVKRRRGGALVHGDNGTVLKLACPFCFTLQVLLD